MRSNRQEDHDSSTASPPAPRPAAKLRGPWARLLRAVLDLAGDQAELVRHIERDWASATFSGTRHSVTLSFNGAEAVAAGEDFIAALPEYAFDIPRWLVADATISSVDDNQLPERELVVEAELLLLEQA